MKLIADMSPGEIWTRYVRYIGAGAVATGGLITLMKLVIDGVLESELPWVLVGIGAAPSSSRCSRSTAWLSRWGSTCRLPPWCPSSWAACFAWAGLLAPLAAGLVFLALIAFFWRLTKQ